jgi:hypothetical protein
MAKTCFGSYDVVLYVHLRSRQSPESDLLRGGRGVIPVESAITGVFVCGSLRIVSERETIVCGACTINRVIENASAGYS